jgi:hypothetical protein
VHPHYARMVQHYQGFSFFEDLSLLLELHHLALLDNFHSIELHFFICKKNAAVRSLPEKALELEIGRRHFLDLRYNLRRLRI